MKAMIGFNKALMSMKMPWPLWLGLLVALNASGAIYFFGAIEAKVVLAAFIAGMLTMTAIFGAKGFVRLLGIGHIFWLPLLPWLVTRLESIGLDSPLGYWIVAVIVVDGISLVIDAVDVFRYLRGEREPYLPAPGGTHSGGTH